MPTYAIIRDGQFVEWRDFDALPPHRPGSVLPQVVDPFPDYDAATQWVEAGIPVIEDNQVRKTWRVVQLGADDLTQKAIAVDLDQARQVYAALKAGTGTDAARMRRVEAVLAAVLRYVATKDGMIVQ